MAEKLAHLPTKPTTVKPEEGRPFVRKQHFQPNKPEPKDRPMKVVPNDGGGERKQSSGEKPKLRLLKKPEAPAGSLNQPLSPTEPRLSANSSPVEAKSAELSYAEDQMAQHLPEEIFGNNNFKEVGKGTANGVYSFQSEDGNYEFYWKPKQGEDAGWKKRINDSELLQRMLGVNPTLRDTIPGNYGGREILAYESSKMLGTEGLIPPTMNWTHQIKSGTSGLWDGPAQMSVHDFGEKILGHEDMQLAPELNQGELRKVFDKAKNGTDLVALDFIMGNTDRNAGNFFVGKDRHGSTTLMAIDNGLAFPEHKGDAITPDWHPTLNTQHEFFKSKGADNPISSHFVEGIMHFDEAKFNQIGKQNGVPEVALQATVDRISMLRDKISEKYVKAIDEHQTRDWESVEERRSVLTAKAAPTGHDLADVIESQMIDKTTRSNGEKKYTNESFGSGFWNERDWTEQIRYGIGRGMFE